MKLLLDTAVFLWYLTADPRLSEEVRVAIRSADNEVCLSAVSLWEILVKRQLGRLSLPAAPALYLPEQRQRHGIDTLPLHEEAIAHLPKLPPLHRDPFDRMLICQAIEHELTLATADEKLRAYPVKTLWAS